MTVFEKIYNSVPEIVFIVIASSLLGFAYNYFREKPLDIMYQPPAKISDSDLFKSAAEALSAQSFENTTVTYKQVLSIIDNPDFFLIDARRPEDYAKGHIGNAINIFPYMEDEYAYEERIFFLPRDKTIIIYCDGGNCDLSDDVYKTIMQFDDFGRVFLYRAGWEEWIEKRTR